MFTLFPQGVFGGSGGLIGDILSKASRITRKTSKEEKVFIRLAKIEEQLGFSDSELERAAPLLRADVGALERFDPLKDRGIKKAFNSGDMETFKTALFQYVADNHLDSPIVLRWWDASEDFRNLVFFRLDKRHLAGTDGDPRLLLKWWEEAKRQFQRYRLVIFIRRAFEEGNTGFRYRGDLLRILHYDDPFLDTVLRATRESEEFAGEIQRIVVDDDLDFPTAGLPEWRVEGGFAANRPPPGGREDGILPTDEQRWGSDSDWADWTFSRD